MVSTAGSGKEGVDLGEDALDLVGLGDLGEDEEAVLVEGRVVAERDALNKQVDKSKQEFTKQIELLTKTHADSQAQMTTEHKAKVSQMEASMKSAGEDSDKQLADMVQQRKKEETKSASLQQELVKAQQR